MGSCDQSLDMYERGDLLDQKLTKKQLIAVPEFKQQHFTPIRTLPIKMIRYSRSD